MGEYVAAVAVLVPLAFLLPWLAGRTARAQADGVGAGLRVLARQQRALVVSAGILFVAWELVRHILMVLVPMTPLHQLSVVVEVALVVLVSTVVFRIIAGYQRRLEIAYQELREAEALRDDLTNMVVHDMKNPLTVILGYVELAARVSTQDAGSGEWIGGIGEAARNLRRMVDNWLDIARLEAGVMQMRLETVEIVTALRETADQLGIVAESNRIRLVVEAPLPALAAQGDPALLERILTNLVGNGVKHAPAGSTVTLAAEPVDGSALRVTVTDDGAGVPPELAGRLFEKFVHGGHSGGYSSRSSGLGLAFCKLAVEAQGGQIGVENSPGRGARFWFTLPRAQGRPSSPSES
ncbi:MAG: HAMP domain-containing histidine kinase [Armatimonadetes bacterium]|nr:HAMP domain-containing histidine kinase [Armatimonadota bacterium]